MKLLLIILISFLFTEPISVNAETLKTVDVTVEGNRYIGEVLNGERHGKGTFTENNGNKYVGEWKNGKMHGTGVLTLANGNRWEGAMKAGQIHGKGKMTTADGIIYEGEMENGQMHGQGILVEKEGKYEGAFLNGKMHGEGVLNLNDGRVFKGEFKNGKYIGVSKSSNNEIAQTQNIKKVEDEQQTIEQDSRIEKQYKAQEKKIAEQRQKAVEERDREYQEEERKKERKRIETFGTLDDAMRKRTENRGKFGFTFQMNIKEIIKKCKVDLNKEWSFAESFYTNCPVLDKSVGLKVSYFDKNGDLTSIGFRNLRQALEEQEKKKEGRYAFLTSIEKNLAGGTANGWKKLINTLNSKYKLLRSPSSEEKEKFLLNDYGDLTFFFENTKNPNEPKYIAATKKNINGSFSMKVEYLAEVIFQGIMKEINKEESRFDDL